MFKACEVGLAVGCLCMALVGGAELSPAETSGLSFKASSFSRLPVKLEPLERPFQWPTEEAFRRTHEAYPQARPVPLLRGHLVVIGGRDAVGILGPAPSWEELLALLPEARLRQQTDLDMVAEREAGDSGGGEGDAPYDKPEADPTDGAIWVQECPNVLVAFQKEGEFWIGLDFLGLDTCTDFPKLSSLESLGAGPDHPIVQVDATKAIGFKPASRYWDRPLRADLWEAWTYTATLLELSRPLYDADSARRLDTAEDPQAFFERQEGRETALANAMQEGREEGLAAIRRALDDGIEPRSRILGEAADFAEEAGELELALRLRSRYRPVGACSMDTAPQSAARAYSELCFRMGDLPCFLSLQLRIMGDAFERVAYSNYGEAAHRTEAERLWDLGIDVGRFLKGLIVQFQVEDRDRFELGAWRLARSIKEVDADLGIGSSLDDLVSDNTLDPYNRLRATMALAYLRVQREMPKQFDKTAARAAWAKALEDVRRLDLGPEARLWIDGLASVLGR